MSHILNISNIKIEVFCSGCVAPNFCMLYTQLPDKHQGLMCFRQLVLQGSTRKQVLTTDWHIIRAEDVLLIHDTPRLVLPDGKT